MLKSCPNPVDVQDILFKLHCRLRVFDNKDINTFSHAHSLISCASRFGLFFVGSNTNNLQAIQLKCVENYTAKDKDVANYPRRNVALPSPAKHVSVNCDSTILAVVVEKDTCPTVIFYDVLSFYKQTPVIIREVRLSVNPGVRVSEVNWNPALPLIFTACKSDGTLGVYELKDNSIDINELPSAAETTSFCWSPKGKQIAVGSKNGKITQYKPDLKAVKVINEPQLGGPHSLISLQWVSNYQFIGVYQSAEPEGQAKVVVVDSSKTGETNYTNYEDVCYSGTGRLPQFYMLFQQHWNLLMVASSNSTEVGVLGSTADTWTQWIISDSARAELPLSSDKQETLPVGLALDISPTKPLPWGEGTIPPCPYLLILSHQGVLCFFDIVNLKPGVPGICCPPDNVQDTSGLAQFVVEEVKESTQEKGTPTIQPQSTLTFGAPQTVAFSTAPQANSNEVKPSQTFTIPPAQPQSSTPFSMFGSATSKPITTEPKLSFTNPGNSLSNPKTSENPPLFGGQTTLAATTSPKSSAPSFKIGETVITPATIAQIPTTSDKYASIFGALNTPTSIPLASQSKPITVPGVPNSAPSAMPLSLQKPLTSTPQIPKAELKIPGKPTIPPARQVSDPKAVVDEKLKGETDALLAKMVKDECVALESELKALLHQGRRVRIDVGNNDEKLEMLNQMEALQEFIKEIVDISLGENAEVHNLKQNLILSWAWYEEALSRYNVSKNETMNLLLKAQPLDSATEKRQSDIQKLVYYLESQLSQVHKALDEQWEKFQDYAKKTHRVQMPTMEAIFQSMVRQNAVLQKQSYILKDISGRIKHKKLSASEPSLFLTLDDGTKKLENDLKRLQIDPDDPHRKLYEKPMNKRKHFTSDKRNKLRDLLKTHEVVHVTAAKPQLNSTLPFSPASRSKQIYSLLGAQMSPVQKVAVARNLDFSQSTPVRESKPEIKPTSAPPNTPAQTESQKTFTFKNLEKSLPNTVVTNSNPLFSTPKSVLNHFLQSGTQPNLPFGAPSAFVPTAQSAKLLSFTQIPEKSNVASSISSPSFSFAPTATGTIPKTTTMNVTASVPLSKTSSSTQFSFGNSITITPISKKSETLPITTTPSTAGSSKALFSFGGTSSAEPSSEVTVTGLQKTSIITSNFGSILQTKSSSPFVAVTTTPSSFSFGSLPSTKGVSSAENIKTSVPDSISTSTTSSKSGMFGSRPSSTSISTVTEPSSSVITTSSAPVTTTFSTKSIFGSTGMTSSTFGTSVTTTSSADVTTTSMTKPSTIGSTATSSIPTFGPLITLPSSIGSATTTSSFGTSSIFGSTSAPTIETNSNKTTAVSTAFGSSEVTSSTPSGSAQPLTKSDTTSIFGNITTSGTTSIFGNSSTPSISSASSSESASTSKPTGSIFGFTSATATASTPSAVSSTSTTTPLFGVSSTVSASGTSIFGSSTEPVPTSTSIFGSSSSSATTKPSTFGSGSIFGTSTSSTTQASVFGSTTTQPSIFGTATAATTTSSIFGTTPVTTSQASIFGSSGASSQQGSIFGGGSTTQPSVFGTASTASTQSSIFGSVTSTSTVQPSIFGAASTTSTVQPSIFGAATTSASPEFGATTTSSFGSGFARSGSIFGTPKTTSSTFGTGFGSTSIFGSAPATTTQGFGQPAFGAAPAFGTPTTASSVFGSGSTFSSNVSSSSNVFGSPAASSSFSFATATANANTGTGSFGFGNLNVSSTPTTSSNIFGAVPPANPFGGASIFGSPPTTSSSIFGSNTNNTQSGFGTSTFASPPAFGQQSTFGQGAFGGTSFGSPQPGPFSASGGTAVGQSGFGASPSFQKPSAFGGAPVFGGSPQSAFGASPSFGGAPAFGAAPAFGSPTKVFGSNTPTAAFGSAATGSPGFGNLATQNTVGFGNLAQQGASPTSTQFSGNASFSSWR